MAAGWIGSLLGEAWSPNAVVVTREAQVMFAPVSEAGTAKTLPEGAEVRVLRRFGDWSEVEVDGQRAGWIRTGQWWGDLR